MNNIRKVAFVIVNNLLIKFGLRIFKDKIIFMYRVPDYTKVQQGHYNTQGKAVHVIEVTSNLNKAFEFLKLDMDTVLNAKNVFEMTRHIIENCPYITKGDIQYVEKQVGTESTAFSAETQLLKDLTSFVKYAKQSQVVLPEFDYTPLIMYSSLKEQIIRAFFKSPILEHTIRKYKLTYLYKEEVEDKYNSKKLVSWIPELKNDSKLAGMVSLAFVTHVTEGDLQSFPEYLVDTPRTIVRREVETFFDYTYSNTDEYKIHILEGANNEDVIQ